MYVGNCMRFVFAPDDGTGAGTNAETQAPASNGNAGTAENNTGDNTPSFSEFWDDPTASDDPPQNKPTNQPPQTPTTSPMEAFQQRVSNLDLLSDFPEELNEQIQQGDFSGLKSHINKGLQGALMQAVMLGAQMIQTNNQSLQTKIDRTVNTTSSAREAKARMFAELPFTKDPSVSPIAEAVMARALKKNNGSLDKALEMTKGYFKAMRSLSLGDADDTEFGNLGEAGAGGIRGSRGQPQPNWDEVFDLMKPPAK